MGLRGPFREALLNSYRLASRLAAALVVTTWLLLVFGSTVRAHGAGLACPDWPLCFGEVVPRLDFHVFLEWGHRVLAGGVSVVYLTLGGLLFAKKAPRNVRLLWGAGLVVLAVQIVLGGLTVLELLAEWTVTSHLVAGNTFTLTLFVLALTLRELDRPLQREAVGPAQRLWAMRLGALVLAQLTLGGLVSSSGAGLACGTWPGCNGAAWFPTLQGLIGLQVAHRIGAYLVLAAALVTAGVTRLHGRTGKAALIVVGLVLAQAGLGIANVFLRIPVELSVAHAGGAALVVLATTWLVYETWRAPLTLPVHAPFAQPVGAK